MTEVACFCGCCFSFDGGAGACPACGEGASVTPGPVHHRGAGSRPGHPVPVGEAGRTLFMNAVSGGLAGRYAPVPQNMTEGAH
jgi:hypothetical protein